MFFSPKTISKASLLYTAPLLLSSKSISQKFVQTFSTLLLAVASPFLLDCLQTNTMQYSFNTFVIYSNFLTQNI